MRKYLKVVTVTIQESSAYRLNHFLSFLTTAIPLLAIIMLWETVFDGMNTVGGFSKSMMLTYFILVRWLSELTSPVLWWEITSDIRDGGLSTHLLRPVNYQLYNMAIYVGSKIPYAAVGLLILLPFMLAVKEAFLFQTEISLLVVSLLSGGLAIVLGYQFSYFFSMIAFWLKEDSGLQVLTDILIPFAMGTILPFDLLPNGLVTFLNMLPFQYLLYFPVNIYLGRVEAVGILKGLSIQVLWMLSLLFLNRIAWRKGLKQYTAVGG